MEENKVGAECKECGIELIDEQGVIRVHPYVIDGDSLCEACRDKRMMIARRYGKKIDVVKVHPEVEKIVNEHNERQVAKKAAAKKKDKKK